MIQASAARITESASVAGAPTSVDFFRVISVGGENSSDWLAELIGFGKIFECPFFAATEQGFLLAVSRPGTCPTPTSKKEVKKRGF